MTRVLADFAGRWQIVRRITHAGQAEATFTGTGDWRAEDDGLAYREQGVLQVPGHREMQSEQRYVWKPGLRVYFDDGRFFHQVPPTGGATEHWCDPDQYQGSYHFGDWPDWRVTWRVTGPRKDYVMRSGYKYSGPS